MVKTNGHERELTTPLVPPRVDVAKLDTAPDTSVDARALSLTISHQELQATDGRYHFKLLPDLFKTRIPISYQSRIVLLFPYFSSMLPERNIDVR